MIQCFDFGWRICSGGGDQLQTQSICVGENNQRAARPTTTTTTTPTSGSTQMVFGGSGCNFGGFFVFLHLYLLFQFCIFTKIFCPMTPVENNGIVARPLEEAV